MAMSGYLTRTMGSTTTAPVSTTTPPVSTATVPSTRTSGVSCRAPSSLVSPTFPQSITVILDSARHQNCYGPRHGLLVHRSEARFNAANKAVLDSCVALYFLLDLTDELLRDVRSLYHLRGIRRSQLAPSVTAIVTS
jgi:hypothetical protein